MDAFRGTLMKYHDELADLKSYFDGHMDDDTMDQSTLPFKKHGGLTTYSTLSVSAWCQHFP